MTTAAPFESEARVCQTCGHPFSALICRNPFDASKVLAVAKHCPSCVEAEKERMANATAAREREQREAQLSAAWERICPVAYRTPLEGGTTDTARLEASLPQFGEILAHPLGPQGLILRGPTGAGKTRAMFRLLRSYFVSAKRPKIAAMTAGEFDREARDAAGTFTLSDWFDRLASADVLFVDDLGKGRWTAATAGQFWEVVDARTKRNRPVFLTTNCSGTTLVASIGLDKDIADPLLRRLRESCKVVVCSNGKAHL